jgi:hypothetical protein
MTYVTIFHPLTRVDWAKVYIFDHPQEKEGLNWVIWVPAGSVAAVAARPTFPNCGMA